MLWLCMLIFARVVNMVLEHIIGCKCCDQMWVVWMLEIWIIIVIIEYSNGYKCCSFCCKCYNSRKACFGHSAGHTRPWYTAVCKWGSATRPGYTAVYPARVGYCLKFFKSWNLAPNVFFTHLMHNRPYINMLCMN